MAITLEYNIGEDQGTYQRMIGNLPPGQENNTNGLIVPSHTKNKPQSFLLKDLTPDIPYVITIVPETGSPPAPQIGFVPTSTEYAVAMALPKGTSIVDVLGADGRTGRFYVTVTHYAVIFRAEAREITEHSLLPLQRVKENIESPVGFVLALPMIGAYSRYIPTGLEILGTLSNKLLVKNLLNRPGTEGATTELLAAFGASNPVFFPMKNLGTPETPLYKGAEDFAGFEAHLWLPNREVERWRAFVMLVNNLPQLYSLLEVDEGQVYVEIAGRNRRHIFDFESEFANTVIEGTTRDECFLNLFRIDLALEAEIYIDFCQAAYALDNMIPAPGLETPDGDPLAVTNWTNLTLTGRLEQQWDIAYQAHNWIWDAPVSGDVDGVNRFYDLSTDPMSRRAVKLFLDGLLLRLNIDYRISVNGDFRSGSFILSGTGPIYIDIEVGDARPFVAPVFGTLEVIGTANLEYVITAGNQSLTNVSFIVSGPPAAFSTPEEARLHYITPALAANAYSGANQYGTETLTPGMTQYTLTFPTPATNINYQLFIQLGEDPLPGGGPTDVDQIGWIPIEHQLTHATIEFTGEIEHTEAVLHWWLIEDDNVAVERGTLLLTAGSSSVTIPFTNGPYLDPVTIIVQAWTSNPLGTKTVLFTSLKNLTTLATSVQFSHPVPTGDYRLDYCVFPAEAGNLVEIFVPPATGQLVEAHYDTVWEHWAHTGPNEFVDGIRREFTLPYECPFPEAMYLVCDGRLLTQGASNQYVLTNPNTIKLGFTPAVGQYIWAVYPIANQLTGELPNSVWSQTFMTRQINHPGSFAVGSIKNAAKIEPGDSVNIRGFSFTAKAPAQGLLVNALRITPSDSITFVELGITFTGVLFTSPSFGPLEFPVGNTQDTDAAALVAKINSHPTTSAIYFAEYLGGGISKISAKNLTGTASNQTITVIGGSIVASNIVGDSDSSKDEVQTITFSTPPTGGKFNLYLNGYRTVDLPYNCTAIDVQDALRALPDLTDVTVSGNFTSGFTVTFTVVDGAKDQPLLIAEGPSISFVPGDINVVDDEITLPLHGLEERESVGFFTSSGLPAPLVAGTTYYVNVVDANTIKLLTTPDGPIVDLTSGGLGTHTLVGNSLTNGTSPITTTVTETTKGFGNFFASGVSKGLDSISLSTSMASNAAFNKIYFPVASPGKVSLTAKRLGSSENAPIVLTGTSMSADSMTGGKNPVYDPPMLSYKTFYNEQAPVITLDGLSTRWLKTYSGNSVKFDTKPVSEQEPYYISQIFPIDNHPLDSMAANAECSYPKGVFTQGMNTQLTELEVDVEQEGELVITIDNLPIQEAPSGTIDGINDTFDLTLESCAGQDSLMLWVDGIFQPPTTYTYQTVANHGQVTLSTPPVVGQTLWAWYLPLGDACVEEHVNALVGAIDGVNQTYTVPDSPFVNRACLVTFLEGLFQLQDSDYTVNLGNTSITFLGTRTPETGQSLWAHFNEGNIGSEEWRQVQVGVADGIQTTFTIPFLLTAELPISQDSVILALDGLVQREGVDFTVDLGMDGTPSGDITFTGGAPEVGRVIQVAYIRR